MEICGPLPTGSFIRGKGIGKLKRKDTLKKRARRGPLPSGSVAPLPLDDQKERLGTRRPCRTVFYRRGKDRKERHALPRGKPIKEKCGCSTIKTRIIPLFNSQSQARVHERGFLIWHMTL